jgi:hypothetical protein
MKALISPNEVAYVRWVSSWVREENVWEPVYSEITGCQRVAEVEPDDKVFAVATPLHWVDCPDECVADAWYYKDGVHKKPEDAPKPE